MIDAGSWEALVASLLIVHYDPAYATSADKSYVNLSHAVSLPDLSPASLEELADRLHSGALFGGLVARRPLVFKNG